MNFLGHEGGFWLAVAGATVVKLVTSENHSLGRIAAMVACALFSAWAFTKPTIAYLELNPDQYEVLVAAVWALTGEGIMRSLISITSSSEKILEFINALRGKK